MGAIYKVHHNLLDEVRVIKVMRPNTVGSIDLQERFVREAKLVTRLNHPNIATTYDFAIDGDMTAYIVMEFIDGLNLIEILKAVGPLDLPLVLEIANQTLGALGYLHRKNIVHRDISPENIMLCKDDEDRLHIKLIDLGIAKALDNVDGVTQTGVFLGKFRYSSPEQLMAGDETIDGRSDLYALGVVLYQLLTARTPISGDGPQQLMAGHMFHPPLSFDETDPGGAVPPEVRTMIMKLLEKKREDRFETAEELESVVIDLQRRFPARSDLTQTLNLVSALRTTKEVAIQAEQSPTPSAQIRLDRQFGAEDTPYPTSLDENASGPLTETPGEVRLVRPTPTTPKPISRPDPTEPSAAKPVAETVLVGSQRAPATSPPLPHEGQPLDRPIQRVSVAAPGSSARSRMVPITIGAILIGIVALVAGLQLRSPQAVSDLDVASPVSISSPAGTQSSAPIEIVEQATTIAQQGQPAIEAPIRLSPVPPAVEPQSGTVTSGQRAARARVESNRSKASAVEAGAPTAAAATYARGTALERSGDAYVQRSQFEAAITAYEGSARTFAISEGEARAAAAATVAMMKTAATKPVELPPPSPIIESPPPPRAAPQVTTAPTVVSTAPSDEDAIRVVINQFIRAQTALDVTLYLRVFPSASADRQKLEKGYETLRSQTVSLEISKIEVDRGGRRAEVHAFEDRTAVPRVGTQQHITGDRIFAMEKKGETWVIASIRSGR